MFHLHKDKSKLRWLKKKKSGPTPMGAEGELSTGHKGNFWGDDEILYQDRSLRYMSICICQISVNGHLRSVLFFLC